MAEYMSERDMRMRIRELRVAAEERRRHEILNESDDSLESIMTIDKTGYVSEDELDKYEESGDDHYSENNYGVNDRQLKPRTQVKDFKPKELKSDKIDRSEYKLDERDLITRKELQRHELRLTEREKLYEKLKLEEEENVERDKILSRVKRHQEIEQKKLRDKLRDEIEQEKFEKRRSIEKENAERELEFQSKLQRQIDDISRREKSVIDREKELQKRETVIRYQQSILDEEEELVQREKLLRRKEDSVKNEEALHDYRLRNSDELRPMRQERYIEPVGPKLLISPFSGSDVRTKNEVSFEEWKIEIDSLVASQIYHNSAISQAIRQSLRGQARKVLINLSPTASPPDIVMKMEDIFGDMSSTQSKMIAFYTAEQSSKESIAEWGLRLEETLQMTKTYISKEKQNEMLKEKFWRSLYNREIKNAIRNSFESKDTFEILRRKARAEEQEIKQIHSETSENEIFKTLLNKMERLEKRIMPKEDTHRKYYQEDNNTLTEILRRMEVLEKKVDRNNKSGEQEHHEIHNSRNKQNFRRNDRYQNTKFQNKQQNRTQTESNKAETSNNPDKADRQDKPGSLNR